MSAPQLALLSPVIEVSRLHFIVRGFEDICNMLELIGVGPFSTLYQHADNLSFCRVYE